MGNINLITNSCNHCSGFCSYCNARIDDLISQGFNINDLEKSLKDINEKNYKEAKWDFEKLEKKLVNHPIVKRLGKKDIHLTLWGADPLNSFYCLQENVDFLKYINKKYDLNFKYGFCTNGLGLLIPEWVEYLIKEKIHFTISHDGLGQEIRTMDFDPIKFDGFKEAYKNKLISGFSPVLNQYNSNPLANYEWFEENTPHDISLRFSKAKNGLYDIKVLNKNGLCNGLYYEELKGKPYGDFLIHNDLTNDILANQLDIYINGWKYIYSNLEKFSRVAKHAIRFARSNDGIKEKNYCYKFQNGITNFSSTIDTIGNDCDCMLMDSRFKAKHKEVAEYCKDCKYNGRYECKECNVMEFPKKDENSPHGCEFNYRYQELMDFANSILKQKMAKKVFYLGPKKENDIKEHRRYILSPYYKSIGYEDITKINKQNVYKELIIENPYSAYIEEMVKRSEKVIYDRSENWSAKNEKGKEAEDIIFKKADVIINSSKKLFDDSVKRSKIGASIYYVPNGSKFFVYKETEKFEKKTAIYIGNSKKCDYELISKMCIEYPDWNFLVYANYEEDEIRKYSAIKNLKIEGFKPLNELFDILCKCHVGLMTLNIEYGGKKYLDSQLPSKLFNYINARLPVVYNNIDENNIEEYKEVCFKYKEGILNEVFDIKDKTFEKLNRSWKRVFDEISCIIM